MTGRATAIDCARLVLWHMWGSAAVRTHIVTANALYRLHNSKDKSKTS